MVGAGFTALMSASLFETRARRKLLTLAIKYITLAINDLSVSVKGLGVLVKCLAIVIIRLTVTIKFLSVPIERSGGAIVLCPLYRRDLRTESYEELNI